MQIFFRRAESRFRKDHTFLLYTYIVDLSTKSRDKCCQKYTYSIITLLYYDFFS